jgi:hypothetical protein
VRFFLQVLRVGAGNPVLGALPVGFQPPERAAHTLVGDLARGDPLLEADLGGQFQLPGAAILANIARAAMQQLLEALGSFFREGCAQPMGTRRPLLQHGQPGRIEALDHVTHSLVVAAQVARDHRGSFSTSRGQQDRASAQHEGI